LTIPQAVGDGRNRVHERTKSAAATPSSQDFYRTGPDPYAQCLGCRAHLQRQADDALARNFGTPKGGDDREGHL